jgi:hypothetical protein
MHDLNPIIPHAHPHRLEIVYQRFRQLARSDGHAGDGTTAAVAASEQSGQADGLPCEREHVQAPTRIVPAFFHRINPA